MKTVLLALAALAVAASAYAAPCRLPSGRPCPPPPPPHCHLGHDKPCGHVCIPEKQTCYKL
jgi:hypothetical protein